MFPATFFKIDSMDVERKKTKFANRLISGINFVVLTFYAISIGIIQSQGLNTTGLETICDLNTTSLSSKTGYLLE
jgi:hypothetical protein